MNEELSSELNQQDRSDALACAALLRSLVMGLGCWSFLLSALAVIKLVVFSNDGHNILIWSVMLLGLCERYCAFRLLLDQRLFENIGHGAIQSLSALDVALSQCGLRAVPESPQPLADRMRGVQSWIKRYVCLVLIQTFILLLYMVKYYFL